MQRSQSVGVVRLAPDDGIIPVVEVGAEAWPERPVSGLKQPFAATDAGSVELGHMFCSVTS